MLKMTQLKTLTLRLKVYKKGRVDAVEMILQDYNNESVLLALKQLEKLIEKSQKNNNRSHRKCLN